MSSAEAITTETAMLMPVLIWKEPKVLKPVLPMVPYGGGGGGGGRLVDPCCAVSCAAGEQFTPALRLKVVFKHTGLPDMLLHTHMASLSADELRRR